MAISTVKATIQMRRGLERDFNPDKMTAGEWAVSTDTKYVRMCFAPGLVYRMATYESFEQDLEEVRRTLVELRDINAAVEQMEALAAQHSADAEASRSAAAASEESSAASAADAAESKESAVLSAESAETSKNTAAAYAESATASAADAAESKDSAMNSYIAARERAQEAYASMKSAEANAAAASSKSIEAEDYARQSRSYAVGTGGARPDEATNNAKYYFERTMNISESFDRAFRPGGTIEFAALPALPDAPIGIVYNISDEFTTTADFNEGAGVKIQAGADVYKDIDGKWNVFSGSSVVSIKGEKGYKKKKGDVVIYASEIFRTNMCRIDLTLSTQWTDITDRLYLLSMDPGCYIIYADVHPSTNGSSVNIGRSLYAGTMCWYPSIMETPDMQDEILLQHTGCSPDGNRLFLRTARVGGVPSLQAAFLKDVDGVAEVSFTFRNIIDF